MKEVAALDPREFQIRSLLLIRNDFILKTVNHSRAKIKT